jgi:hypothetical protein
VSDLHEQLQIPLAVAVCGYCGTPMQAPTCASCASQLAQISTASQWQEFMTLKQRELRRKSR